MDAEMRLSMRRKRFQKGSIRARKHGRQKVWVAQWREGGAKRSKVLGRCSEVSKGEAEALLAQLLSPINESAGQGSTRVFTFQQYVEEVFLPACREKWKESTRATSEPDIMRYLMPSFGREYIGSIKRQRMQAFLKGLASHLSDSVVGHLRWHLNAIFKMAQSDGLVDFNPAGALFIPACKTSGERRVMEKEEVRQALGILDLRERLIFRMAVFDGMRPGEIFAITLGKVAANSVLIDQRVYGGTLDTPKGRKGKRTSRVVALSPGTVTDFKLWKSFLGDTSDEAYLFPSEAGCTPLRPNNLWKRAIRPRLQKIGLEWVNFQVLRRTNASLSRKANIDDKVSADQRGHGLGVSLAVYAISDLEQKSEAVSRLEAQVIPPASAVSEESAAKSAA